MDSPSPYGRGAGWGKSQKQKSPYIVEALFLQPKIIFYILVVNGQLLEYLQHGNQSDPQ